MTLIEKLYIGFDQGIILAIIAINMTVIGLTSLAETKKVIGIDYGKFLIKEYKLGYVVRIYYLLILFAFINVFSLISMFLDYGLLNAINCIILLISLTFAIYYFFSYILVENEKVKKQIYEKELTGMYYKSLNDDHFEVDKIVNIPNGYKTSKRISSSVVHHFNFDSDVTVQDFENCFGPLSPIYNYSKNAIKGLNERLKQEGLEASEPYPYRNHNGVVDISHEFFQLFRNSDIQHKWSIDILRICNNTSSNNKEFNKLALYNITRVITHLNTFGNSKGIYNYKFMEHFFIQLKQVFECAATYSLENEKIHLIKVENYLFTQLFKFLSETTFNYKDQYFIRKATSICKNVVYELSNTLLSTDEKNELFLTEMIKMNSEVNQKLVNEVTNGAFTHELIDFIKVNEIKKRVQDIMCQRTIDFNNLDLFTER